MTGYKFDDTVEVYIGIELEEASGHWLQLYAIWPGFFQVVEEITLRLPGISPTWFEKIEALNVPLESLTVWQRES